jgi:hypothetical protein
MNTSRAAASRATRHRAGRTRTLTQHNESKRASRCGGAGQEQGQRQDVEFALAHNAECRGVGAVHGRVEVDVPSSVLPLQGDRAEGDIALLTQLLPDAARLLGQRLKLSVPQLGGVPLQPVAGGLRASQRRLVRSRTPGMLNIGFQQFRDGSPRVFALGEYRRRLFAQRGDRGFEVAVGGAAAVV